MAKRRGKRGAVVKKVVAVKAPAKRDDRGKLRSDFPKFTLRDTIQVAEAIEHKMGGQPVPPLDLAAALKKSPGSSVFKALLSASIRYGLTSGSWNVSRVEIKDAGLRIASPKSHEDKQQAIIEAVLAPPVFREMYDYFKGKKLPENQFFQNTVIREFNIPRDHAGICVSIFLENIEFAGLVRETVSGRWLSADATPQPLEDKITENDVDENDELVEESAVNNAGDRAPRAAPIPTVQASADDPRKKRVFITHGKNQSLVAHLKELLQFGQFEPVVSVDRESVAKPVPDKVMDDMRSCGAAIIHIDAEREVMTKEGEKEIILNGNVLIEIGAAMALYGRRFILLKQKDVRLPSNLQGLYEVRYEGEKLDVDSAIRLMKAFNDFKTYDAPK